MRASRVRPHVALATAIGLTLGAGVVAAGITLSRNERRTPETQALADYRQHVRNIFMDLYDDVQPLEDAVRLAISTRSDVAPAQDLLLSKQVPAGVTSAQHRLRALRAPRNVSSPSRALAKKLDALAFSVDSFPPLDHPDEYLDLKVDSATKSVETALYELSGPLKQLLVTDVPPIPSREPGPKQRASHGSYLVAAAHICGPASRRLDALPRGKAGDAKADDIIDRMLDDLVDVPLPPADEALLERTVLDPLDTDPPVAAEGLAAYGSRSCASLLSSINWVDADRSLNA